MMSGYISDCLGENFSCIQPKPILPQKFNWDVFMATLIPTEGCNFQCSYCHKNHPAASMTRDTLDQIEEYITAQAPRHKQVVLAWLGGEPILCKDTVLEVSEMIQNLQKQHGFQYTAKMTTKRSSPPSPFGRWERCTAWSPTAMAWCAVPSIPTATPA